jgi:c-di-GMP-related signal transduction protein
MLMGLDVLCDGRRAFVNCTRDMLLKDYVTLLPSQQTVVEILESVEGDDLVVAACRRLKESGDMIALDDFIPNDGREKLADFADIIKLDVRRTSEKQRLAMVKRFGPWRSRMLAEKVESRQEFDAACKEGFIYFQGYFFRRPELMTMHEIPTNRLNYIRMLQAVSKPELDPREVENVIKSEASICYRLLSAYSHLRRRPGQDPRISAVCSGAGAFLQGAFTEDSARRFRFIGAWITLVMDVILEIPIPDVLEKVPIDQETRAVLLGGASRLQPLYRLMLALESGEWQDTVELAKAMHLSESEVAEAHWQAMQWARQVSSG